MFSNFECERCHGPMMHHFGFGWKCALCEPVVHGPNFYDFIDKPIKQVNPEATKSFKEEFDKMVRQYEDMEKARAEDDGPNYEKMNWESLPTEPVLYVAVRTMDSMTPGKAQAHSGHAVAKFIYSIGEFDTQETHAMFSEWQGGIGFGTQVNLQGTDDELMSFVDWADETGHVAGIVYDPTYPYEVTSEILDILPSDIHTKAPKPTKYGTYICYRNEWTAIYVFGSSFDTDLKREAKRLSLA